MYTVKELIETLKECPEDYEIRTIDNEGFFLEITAIGFDTKNKTVDFFIK